MSRMEPRNDCRWCLLGAALALTVVLATGSSRAADLNVDGGATYTVNSNVTFDNAYIGNLSTGTLNQGNFTNSLTGSLYLGNNPGSTGIYNLSGGSLSVASGEIVGNFGSGVFTQSGGANACGNLTLGYETGSNGTYNQSDGTNTVSGILFLGYNSGGGGVYNLSGGSLSAGFEYIGYHGLGAFTQNGGANTISNNLYLGATSGSSGTYNLNSGSLEAPNQLVGFHGNGIFNQNGGSNTINKDLPFIGLVLGSWNDGNGTYNLNNGSLSAWSETIGRFGVGTFNQINGTNQVTEDLVLGLGNGLSGSGTYNLSGGKLSADNECLGYNGTGTFNQSGGSNTVATDLVLGCHTTGSGAYTLSGGSLDVGGDETIGDSGSGRFTQTGGVHTIAGDLTLGATPGSRASLAFLGGTLAVGGNYTQNANSSLALGIASGSNYQRINLGGTASLNGTLTPVLLGYRPQGNQVFTVLTATGGLTGTFTLTDPWISPTLYWQQRYHSTSLDLLVERDYQNPGLGLNSNQAAVGAMLNGLAGTTSGDLGGVLNAIDNLGSGREVAGAFQQISPDKAASLATLGFAGAGLFRRGLANRITNLRYQSLGGAGGPGGLGSFNLNYSGASGLMLAYNSSSLAGLITAKKKAEPESRWGLYLDPGLALGSQKSSSNQTGFNFTIAGFNAGADYRVRDDFLVGLASGYSHTGAAFRGSGGAVENNTWPLTAYAAYLPESFYAYGSLGYALNLFRLERNLSFGSLSRITTSSPSGHQFNAYGEAGYDVKASSLVLTPLVSLAYSNLWVNGFTESGAGSLNLQVDSQQADSLQTGVGAKIALPLKRNGVTVVPQAYATYQHEFANSSRGLDARLSQGGGAFAFQSEKLGQDFAVLGANVTLITRKNFSLHLDYNAEAGRANYTAHCINAGLRYEF